MPRKHKQSQPAHEEPGKDVSQQIPLEDTRLASDGEQQTEKAAALEQVNKPALPTRLRQALVRLARFYWSSKLWTIPATVVLLLALDLFVPVGGYPIIGLAVKSTADFQVLDSITDRPVAGVAVQFGGTTAVTSAEGKAALAVPIGSVSVGLSKPYYKSLSTKITMLPGSHRITTVHLVALGRQVPITVKNKITGKPLAGVTVKALQAQTITDQNGKAVLVLPISANTQAGTISASGYNDAGVTIQVTDQEVVANTFTVMPAGHIYFLSNLSGKIDVVKTNLDGTDRKTVVAGTGFEVPTNTVLLASRDWKYLALYSKRSKDGNQEINLIDTTTDKMTNIDEGDASFNLIGWDGDSFIYRVDRNSVKIWQNNHEVLKSFDAVHKTIAILASSEATGNQYSYKYQDIGAYIIDDKIVYITDWSTYNGPYYYYDSGYSLNGKSVTVRAVGADGSNNTLAKSFALGFNISFNYQTYDEPNTIVFRYQRSSGTDYYEYSDDKLAISQDITDDNGYYNSNSNATTYLESPSATQTLWQQPADGKYAIYVGDRNGKQGKAIATLVDYAPYGWYTDDYVLVSKNGSELYIMSATGGTALRITDYFKSAQYYRGYGGGYGGL